MPTSAVPLILSLGAVADIVGGNSIGLSDQTGVVEIPSFTAIAGTGTLTITPNLNGCVGTPQTVVVTVNPNIRPAVLSSDNLWSGYKLLVGDPYIVFSGSLAQAQAARVVLSANPTAIKLGQGIFFETPAIASSYLYGASPTGNCDNTLPGTNFFIVQIGTITLTSPIWEVTNSILIAIHP